MSSDQPVIIDPLRDALRFYASEGNWGQIQDGLGHSFCPTEIDRGQLAREALSMHWANREHFIELTLIDGRKTAIQLKTITNISEFQFGSGWGTAIGLDGGGWIRVVTPYHQMLQIITGSVDGDKATTSESEKSVADSDEKRPDP